MWFYIQYKLDKGFVHKFSQLRFGHPLNFMQYSS